MKMRYFKEFEEVVEIISFILPEEDFKAFKVMKQIKKHAKSLAVSLNLLKYLLLVSLIFLFLIYPNRDNNLLIMFGFGRQFVSLTNVLFYIFFFSFFVTLIMTLFHVTSLRPQLQQLRTLIEEIKNEELSESILKNLSAEQLEKFNDFILNSKD